MCGFIVIPDGVHVRFTHFWFYTPCCLVLDDTHTHTHTHTQEMQEVPPDCDPVPMKGEDILFIAYTSGTQMGTSKAVYHTQAGYLLYTKLTYKVRKVNSIM